MSEYKPQFDSNIKNDTAQRKMFQQAGRDVELEKMISQKKYKTLLMALVVTSAVYTPLLIISFVLAGFYVSLVEIYFHGFGNVHWFAFAVPATLKGQFLEEPRTTRNDKLRQTLW